MQHHSTLKTHNPISLIYCAALIGASIAKEDISHKFPSIKSLFHCQWEILLLQIHYISRNPVHIWISKRMHVIWGLMWLFSIVKMKVGVVDETLTTRLTTDKRWYAFVLKIGAKQFNKAAAKYLCRISVCDQWRHHGSHASGEIKTWVIKCSQSSHCWHCRSK